VDGVAGDNKYEGSEGTPDEKNVLRAPYI